MERILVGVDGSAPSLRAVQFAADLASKYNAELILLTIAPRLSPEVSPEVEQYARVEHIPVLEAQLAFTADETVLGDARREAVAKGATRSQPRRLSAILPGKSLPRHETGEQI